MSIDKRLFTTTSPWNLTLIGYVPNSNNNYIIFQDNLGITLILKSYFIHPQTFFTNDSQLHQPVDLRIWC